MDDDPFIVSQINVLSQISLPANSSVEGDTVQACQSSVTQTIEESSVQILRRGRAVQNSSSSSVCTQDENKSETSQTEELVSELKKISQELGNVDQVSQKQSPNSFISLKSSKVDYNFMVKLT